MATLTQCSDPTQKAKVVESVRPVIHDFNHQDSVFGNSFQPKSHFIVHPDWNSEGVNPPVTTPLNRAPWAWEQPRHRQNVQYPITYQTPRYKTGTPRIRPTIDYTPSWISAFTAPRSEMMQVEGSTGIPVASSSDIPECFRQNGTEQTTLPYQPTTTMDERERMQWHLHY